MLRGNDHGGMIANADRPGHHSVTRLCQLVYPLYAFEIHSDFKTQTDILI